MIGDFLKCLEPISLLVFAEGLCVLGGGTCGLFDFYSFDWELEVKLSRDGKGSGY